MKRYNVVTAKPYTKDGEEKTQWNTVGTIVKFDATTEKPEGMILELHMFPNVKFNVFEQTPREPQDVQSKPMSTNRPHGGNPNVSEETKAVLDAHRDAHNKKVEEYHEEINPADIPF